jgi:hypothetical protein
MTDNDTILNHALLYAARGWAVFPAQGITPDKRCTCGKLTCDRSAGKHPRTINHTGLHEASTDPDEIRRQFNAAGPFANLAIRTGGHSGFFVLDIDGPEGERSLSALEAEHGSLPSTRVNLTGSGRHFLFQYPGVFTPGSTGKIAKKIDIRGDGNYIIGPPSKHMLGVRYRWENQDAPICEAPAWLLEWLSRPEPVVNHERLALPDFTPDDVGDMLDCIPADDYDTWYQVGMALHHEGHAFDVWNSWSSKSSKYFGAKDCEIHWRSFKRQGPASTITIGSLVHLAQAHGWSPGPQSNPKMDAMIADLLANEASKKKSSPVKAVEPEPIQDANRPDTGQIQAAPRDVDFIPSGLIGDTVAWIVKTSIKPQPELALMNVIAAMGAVIGRRYASPWDTRTNIYAIGIAGTGAGKDHSRKQIKKLMAEANLVRFLGGDSIVSDRGMLKGIEGHPEQILHLDEIGMLLQVITGANAAAHLRGVSKALTELYSSSSTVYNSGSYASAEIAPIVIYSPHLCVYGTTTLESYAAALTRTAVKDGSLNRFIVMPTSNDHPPRRRDEISPKVPEALISRWRSIADYVPPGNGDIQALGIGVGAAPTPQTVEWGSQLNRIHDMGDFEDSMMIADKAHGALWNRYRENCIKVAMILAVCRNPLLPIIDGGDLDHAEAIIQRSIKFMVSIADDHIADNPFEKQCNLVLGIIRDGGKTGANRSEIMRKARMKAKDLTDVLSSMSEAGRIYADGDKSSYVRWFVGG